MGGLMFGRLKLWTVQGSGTFKSQPTLLKNDIDDNEVMNVVLMIKLMGVCVFLVTKAFDSKPMFGLFALLTLLV